MTKPVSQNTVHNPVSVSAPSTIPDSPWKEDQISIRNGNCNVLLIAPHGYEKDDEKTYDITRLAADQLDCYAIVNKTFKKPPKIRDPKTKKIIIGSNGKPSRHQPDKSKKWINLNRKDQVHEFLENEFEEPLLNTVNEIIKKFGKALILWIHGIDDDNLTLENTEGNLPGMDALIGVGQGNPEDKLTAKMETVEKLIAALQSNSDKPIKAALAEKDSDYCGRHENIMNQYFRVKYSLDKVESIQIEIRKIGFREDDNSADTAMALADSFSEMVLRPPDESKQAILDSAVQKGFIKQILACQMDLENGQFKARLDDIQADPVRFEDLVKSIKLNGILNNVIVRKQSAGNGKPYQLISGFRRMAALKAAIPENEFFKAMVPARVLDAAVSDDEAYQISFTENLARQDLSLWEIAKACADISSQMEKKGAKPLEIKEHLVKLIQKGDRTVRRYLQLASLDNKPLADAVHTGDISPTMALHLGSRDLEDPEVEALLDHFTKHPKTTREFKLFYGNLEECSEAAKLSVVEVLSCPNSDKFLSLEQKDLAARVKHQQKISGKQVSEILKGEAGSLLKAISGMDAEFDRKSFQDRFNKASDPISKKIAKAFEKSEISADFTIKPGSGLQSEMIAVTISASVDQIQKAIDVVSKEAGEKFASLKKPLESRVVTKTTTKGWEKIKIKTTSGEKVDAIAPLIISASRRNDTPARHSEWFIEGLKRGYLVVSKKPKYVSFKKARLIVFWTKNPEPLLKHLHEIDKKEIGYYFQYTLNDYDERLEPNIPPLAERIETFKRLSDMVGREKVIWRYDPLILAGDATPEQMVGKVEHIMEQLAGHTEKLVISFYRTSDYKHALQRMQNKKIFPRDFDPKEITSVAARLGELGRAHGMKVATCADSGDLSFYGIEHNKCIDDELIKRVFKDDKILIPFFESRKNLRDTGQRKDCQCIVSEEVGSENTCANGCLYCYANKSDKALERNLGLIKESEKVNQKENPEVLPSKAVSPALNSNDSPQANPDDEPKIKRFRGKLA